GQSNYYSSEDGVLFNIDKTKIISCPCGKSGNYIIPSSVKEIGECAFYSCERLTSITIPEGVTSIGCEAFSYCTSLKTINIPVGMEYIESATFAGCFDLQSITIPDSVFYIYEHAFSDCESLSEVYYGGTMEDWNDLKIYQDNDYLTNATVFCSDGTINGQTNPSSGNTEIGGTCGEYAKWELTNGILTIEGTGELYECEEQSYPWYQYRDIINTVIIYSGIENVPERAFAEEYDSLTTVYIAPSVTQIGVYAFYNDEKLKDIYFYGDAPNVGGKCISNNEDLVLHCIDTANGWTDGPDYDSTTNEWKGHKLAGWLDGEGKVEGGSSSVVTLKDGVCTLYSASGHGGCPTRDEGVKKIVLSETIKSIEKMSFDGITFDIELSLPKTLKTIEGYAFARSNSISLKLDSDNPYLKLVDGVLYSADMTELIYASPKLTGDFVTPSTVTTVHDGAFVFSRFDSITISDNVTKMHDDVVNWNGDVWSDGRVFANAQCKHVVIGKNVEKLCGCCFYMCPNLEDITFLGMNTEFDGEADHVVCYSGRGETAFGGDAGTGNPAKLYCYENSNIAQYVQEYEGEWEYLDSGSGESEKPTAPQTAPTISEKTTTSITINWTDGSDDIGVDGYNIYVDGEKVGSTEGADMLSYTIQNLQQGEKYAICVQTVDGEGQVSEMSPELSAYTVRLQIETPGLNDSYITDEYENSGIPLKS
ncbi:MAG: leucine-rich repeat protein, partial [Clostridia bacterium]|nr:leucine-rich repeat protein [Clostridia bacterium]